MAKASTGIYIGRNYVDAVALAGSFKKPTLLDQVKVEIKASPDEIYSLEGKSDKKIVDAISSALNKLRAKSDKIFSALPEAGIMLRHFDMPLLPRSEQIQAIKFEARKYNECSFCRCPKGRRRVTVKIFQKCRRRYSRSRYCILFFIKSP